MMVTEEIFFSKRGLSDMSPYVYPPRSRVPFVEVSENRVNLRNFLVDSLTLFPLQPPFLLFLCRG